MTKLERTIEGLKRCADDKLTCFDGCPYIHECGQLRKDALEQLKAHLPRVLTFEELADEASHVWDVVYI